MSKNINRLVKDLKMTIEAYDKNKIFWASDYSWIEIKDFKLPHNFKKQYTNILILIPDNYGYGGTFNDIFIDTGLEVLDKEGRKYETLDSRLHFFGEYPYNRMSKEMRQELVRKKWGYLCIHDKNPESTILNYLFKVRLYLENIHKDWDSISKYYKNQK